VKPNLRENGVGKITMQEIAVIAGVSLATVSRSIHSPHLVKAETLQMIRRVMEETRYVYNATAGDFSKKRSSVIGVIIPTTKGAIFANSTLVIQEKAQEKGFSVIMASTGYDTEAELRLLRHFQERRLAGVILTGFSIGHERAIEDLVQSGIPCVVVWEALRNSTLSYVGFDNFKAAYSMTDYLIKLKHRDIGLILGPYTKVGRARKRLEGYRAALEENGIPFDLSLVIEKQPTLAEGKEAMGALLSWERRPSAVFAASDMLAIGALVAAREKGLQVPRDISVAGFDDIDFAAYCNPPLTTVRVPAKEIGETAVQVLLEMIEGNSDKGRQIALETELVIRASCEEFRSPWE
jgi:DNA-binding LacI/PurR family transcriptional regulator